MENYLNYFTEIEEYFQKKRESLRLLSPIDWALMESFQQSGIPLEVIFRGIDRAFEKKQKKKPGSNQVNSLSYCVQPILKEFEQHKAATQGGGNLSQIPSQAEAMDRANLGQLVEKARQQLIATRPNPALNAFAMPQGFLDGIAETLGRIIQQIASPEPLDYSALDLQLSMMEEKLLATIQAALSDDELLSLKTQVNTELNQHRRNLKAEHLAMLERKLLNKCLLERFQLPHLNLFYLPLN
jgi:hypothetical protein